jgi:transposase-like protein
MAEHCAIQSPFTGKFGADEIWLSPKRMRGKPNERAREASIVFGLLKQGHCVYTEIVDNASKTKLQAMVRGKVDPNTVICTDSWRGYDALVDMGSHKFLRVNHDNQAFVSGSKRINIIESFWSYLKLRLAQFYGIANHTFVLHLKETEFRFNHRHEDLYLILLKLLRDKPL